jgi:small subunit ribosomal protein S11
MAGLSNNPIFKTLGSQSRIDTSSLMGTVSAPQQPAANKDDPEPYHLHIYAHKHNTHVTCTKPSREPIISLSCGNLGYRKSRRGLYDSAYSLTKYVLDRLVHTGWPPKIDRLELVLRGFGQGRDAAVKVLMSPEGKVLRDKIVRVADSTRIKFAGTRSKRPRRL